MKRSPPGRLLIVIGTAAFLEAAVDPGGFNGALWGQTPEEVRKNSNAVTWQSDPAEKGFPPELYVSVFRSPAVIAGYKASVRYYFTENRLFQATADFDFDDLAGFDFNYNVFRSVNEYYNAIRARTVLFVQDIYDLLAKKYGKRKPVFKGLDPRDVFRDLDRYVLQERWNLRYHPYDFYLNIVTSTYARWDFPQTRVLFSINIAASQKRFDYLLSLSSNRIAGPLRRAIDKARAKGL